MKRRQSGSPRQMKRRQSGFPRKMKRRQLGLFLFFHFFKRHGLLEVGDIDLLDLQEIQNICKSL